MGASESALSAVEGFQVARVIPNSPAHIAGLIPYFDIILAVDGLPLERDNPDFFKDYIKRNQEKPVTFNVFNLRIRAARDVSITPHDQWGGAGLLGCSINWETAERCLDNAWHVVDVCENSPAYVAELMTQRDYIIGMQPPDEQCITMFRDTEDFHNRLEVWRSLRTTNAGNIPPTILFLVFDSVDNSLSEVLVNMGSQLHLGIDVANGYLHAIPALPGSTKLPMVKRFYIASVHETAQGEQGEMMEERGYAGHEAQQHNLPPQSQGAYQQQQQYHDDEVEKRTAGTPPRSAQDSEPAQQQQQPPPERHEVEPPHRSSPPRESPKINNSGATTEHPPMREAPPAASERQGMPPPQATSPPLNTFPRPAGGQYQQQQQQHQSPSPSSGQKSQQGGGPLPMPPPINFPTFPPAPKR